MRWLAVAVGIVLLGLLLGGCSETQTEAGNWDEEIGRLESEVNSTREIVLSNATIIQELQQQIGSLKSGASQENTQDEGTAEQLARLGNSLSSLQRSFDALSAQVDEIESALSEKASASRPAGGRP